MTYDPQTTLPQPKRTSPWPWVALAVAVSAIGIAALFVLRPAAGLPDATAGPATTTSAARQIHVTGVLRLNDRQLAANSDGGPSCTGSGGYDDIRQGADVTATDPSGKVVGLGHLGQGVHGSTLFVCEFRFSVDVPAGLGIYGIEVAHRGVVRYNEGDLRQEVQVQLGDL